MISIEVTTAAYSFIVFPNALVAVAYPAKEKLGWHWGGGAGRGQLNIWRAHQYITLISLFFTDWLLRQGV